jgi:hypothetical protein
MTFAQDNPELGDVRHNPNPPPRQPLAARAEVVTTAPPPAHDPFERDVPVVGNDHASVIGHLGVGYFGVIELPRADVNGGGDVSIDATLSAPTIGARYWLDERMAIEAGFGIGVSSGGTSTKTGNTTVEINDPHLFGLALHGGLPLVFASGAHYAFEVVPELNFGFVTGGRDIATGSWDLSGLLLQLGARIGAEIQFGFIGIPQLALQGSVGLHLSYQSRSASLDNTEVSNHRFDFGTTVQNTPWDIFRSSVAAIYYF